VAVQLAAAAAGASSVRSKLPAARLLTALAAALVNAASRQLLPQQQLGLLQPHVPQHHQALLPASAGVLAPAASIGAAVLQFLPALAAAAVAGVALSHPGWQASVLLQHYSLL
jgi:hypothetical protein